MTKDEKDWIPYKPGQFLIFRSNLNTIDTLLVSDRVDGFSNEDCNLSASTKQLQYIRVLLSHRSGNRSLLHSELSIEKDYKGRLSYPVINIYGLRSDLKDHKLNFQKINIASGKTFNQVIVLQDGKNAFNIENGYLKKLYYDYRSGIIKYEAKDGEIFELLQ